MQGPQIENADGFDDHLSFAQILLKMLRISGTVPGAACVGPASCLSQTAWIPSPAQQHAPSICVAITVAAGRAARPRHLWEEIYDTD